MATVLVTDGDERAALAVVRSLGKSGHRVFAVSTSGRSIAGASRYCMGERKVPDPMSDPEAFIASVLCASRAEETDVLLPISEGSILAVLARPDLFADVRIPFPALPRFQELTDKVAVMARARELGIPDPTVGQVAAPEDRPDTELSGYRGRALVLKPARSVGSGPDGRVKTSVRYVQSGERLSEVLGSMDPAAFPLLVQRRVSGPGVGVFLLLWDGKVIASFAHRRLREKPPAGGVSVLRESIAMPSGLLERSAELLASFRWQGVAMVEYKQELESGEYYLMEVNPRFWGSLQLAVDAGVDFPSLLLNAVLRAPPSGKQTRYKIGVKTRWELGDLDHLLARWTRTPEELGLDETAPGRWKALAAFLRGFFPPIRGEMLRLSDPGPGIRETVAWLGAIMPRASRG